MPKFEISQARRITKLADQKEQLENLHRAWFEDSTVFTREFNEDFLSEVAIALGVEGSDIKAMLINHLREAIGDKIGEVAYKLKGAQEGRE